MARPPMMAEPNPPPHGAVFCHFLVPLSLAIWAIMEDPPALQSLTAAPLSPQAPPHTPSKSQLAALSQPAAKQ